MAALSEIHKCKTVGGVSLGKEIGEITVTTHPDTMVHLQTVIQDVMAAGRAGHWTLETDENLTPGEILVGDVEFASVSEVAGFLTPVPGGVGPMTIAMLLKNTLLARERHQAGN